MASSLRYDPEYAAAIAASAGQKQPVFKDVLELRDFTEKLLHRVFRLDPYPDNVQHTQHAYTSHDGASLALHRFAPADLADTTANAPTAAVLYVHGGGMVSCSVDIFAPAVARQALAARLPFFAVDYRKAPEHPAPCGAEDVFAALRHLSAHAADFNVDPARIAVLGDSGGGGLAAACALLARDRRLSPPLAKQVLVYPMLDDRTAVPDDAPLRPFLTWQATDNVLAWDALLGADRAGRPEAEVPEYAVPARAATLRGLPPTYIDVGGLDLFRDENVAYAARLMREDVEVELHVWPGVPHGFEGAPGATWTVRATASRIRALQGF